MTLSIPLVLRDVQETLTVEYEENTSVEKSGFDALSLPFPPAACLGYPTVQAYFNKLHATGYKSFCGFIQFVQTVKWKDGEESSSNLFIDVDAYAQKIGNPYFSYGYPASFYDAPCKNLGDSSYLQWKAFTYLVDMPTRMNANQLQFLAGFSWGYEEDASGPRKILEIQKLTNENFKAHYTFLLAQYPHYLHL